MKKFQPLLKFHNNQYKLKNQLTQHKLRKNELFIKYK